MEDQAVWEWDYNIVRDQDQPEGGLVFTECLGVHTSNPSAYIDLTLALVEAFQTGESTLTTFGVDEAGRPIYVGGNAKPVRYITLPVKKTRGPLLGQSIAKTGPDALFIVCQDPAVIEQELDRRRPDHDAERVDPDAAITTIIPTTFTPSPDGLTVDLNGYSYTLTLDGWSKFYKPGWTREDLLAYLRRAPAATTSRAKPVRPLDAITLRRSETPLRMPTDTHFISMVREVALSNFDDWNYLPEVYGYALDRRKSHGLAVVENANEEAMHQIVALFGPMGLQVTFGVLQHIEEAVMRKHGFLVPWNDLAPGYKIICTDVLRAMGVVTEGNGYRMDQQRNIRQILKAVAAVQFIDIAPATDKRKRLAIGPLVNVLHTEMETHLPFDQDEVPPKHELLSVYIQPGKAAWELRRKGVPWCHHSVLSYNAKREGPEILLTVYAGQLAINSRNNPSHDGFVKMETMLVQSGIKDKVKSRAATRLDLALKRLAATGAIPAGENGKPIIHQPAADMIDAEPTEARLACKVKLFDKTESYSNGYQPLGRPPTKALPKRP